VKLADELVEQVPCCGGKIGVPVAGRNAFSFSFGAGRAQVAAEMKLGVSIVSIGRLVLRRFTVGWDI
jgi:hypothetical protein